MKKKTAVLILVGLFAGALDLHAGTGWNTNDGGSLQFLDPANWNEGDINGIFPAGWAPTAALSLRLTNDWTGTLTFLGSIAKDTTFYGRKNDDSGAQNRTITLDGDMLIQPSASSGKLIFDATVGFDLGGGTCAFLCYAPSSADKFRVSGPIANGNLILGGNGAGMTLVGDAAVGGDVTVLPNTTLVINWATSTAAVRRTEDLELHRATFAVSAYQRNNTFETGTLRVSGADAAGVSLVTINPVSYVATLRADALDITDGGTLAVMASNLGAEADATTAGRLLFVETPVLAGDAGEAGTPGVAVLPGVVLGTAHNALPTGTINKSENYNGLFLATYDETLGVRRLSDDEIAYDVSGTEAVNLVVTNDAPLAITGDAEVNSLQLVARHYRHAVPQISGEGTLTVKSGMVLMTVPKNGANLNVDVDFDSVQGRFFSVGPHGEQAKILKAVHGTGGLVFSKGMAMNFDTTVAASSSCRGFAISSAADYTGDTYVQCMVEIGSYDFLPHGTRSGNTIVNGCLSFGTIAINGLYGTGAVRGTTLTVGEDGSDSCFAGTGYLTSALNIAGGKFDLEGTIAQGAVNVAAGAAIGGSGGITNDVTFADGAKLAVTVANDVASCLTVAGTVSGGPVTVDVSITSGKWRTAQRILTSGTSMGEMTFVKGAGVGSLELRNNATELWATPKRNVFAVVLR